jgi:hypothetical protein
MMLTRHRYPEKASVRVPEDLPDYADCSWVGFERKLVTRDNRESVNGDFIVKRRSPNYVFVACLASSMFYVRV